MEYLVEPLFCSSHPKEIHEQRVEIPTGFLPDPLLALQLAFTTFTVLWAWLLKHSGCENLSWCRKAPCKCQSRKQKKEKKKTLKYCYQSTGRGNENPDKKERFFRFKLKIRPSPD